MTVSLRVHFLFFPFSLFFFFSLCIGRLICALYYYYFCVHVFVKEDFFFLLSAFLRKETRALRSNTIRS